METYRYWLKNLKVGDKVIVSNAYWDRIAKVERITPTRQIKIEGYETRFVKGRQMGATGYGVPSLHMWSQELEDNINAKNAHSKMVTQLVHTDFNVLQSDKLKRIIEIIKE